MNQPYSSPRWGKPTAQGFSCEGCRRLAPGGARWEGWLGFFFHYDPFNLLTRLQPLAPHHHLLHPIASPSPLASEMFPTFTPHIPILQSTSPGIRRKLGNLAPSLAQKKRDLAISLVWGQERTCHSQAEAFTGRLALRH